MSRSARRVDSVLLTCAMDEGAGGVQVMFRDLIYWLERNGRQVHLLYPAPFPQVRLTAEPNAAGRQAFYCPMPAIVRDSALLGMAAFLVFAPISIFSLTRLIRRRRIHVINCHYLSPYFIHLVIVARLMGVPLVLSVHGADVDAYGRSGWMHRWLLRSIVRGAESVIACSAALARQTMAVFPHAREKVSWVHNGVDLARFTEGSAIEVLPEPFVLSVCRHVHKKGVDTLLEAFARALREMPGLSLILVGDGPLLAAHNALAQRLDIAHRVVFMGDIPHAQVSSVVQRCSVFVLPSRAEPFGIVLLEAAHHGKPIVCTRVGGVPEIITNERDGLLVDADDPEHMAERILTLLRNPDLAGRLGAAARRTLMSRFLWEDRVKDYIAIYEGSPGPSPDAQTGGLAPPPAVFAG